MADGVGRCDAKSQPTTDPWDSRFECGTTFATTYPNALAQYQADSFTRTRQFEYDTRGNTTQQIGAQASLLNKYTYDPAGNLLTAQNNGTTTTDHENSAVVAAVLSRLTALPIGAFSASMSMPWGLFLFAAYLVGGLPGVPLLVTRKWRRRTGGHLCPRPRVSTERA
jgi:hypothetical protein